MRGRSEELAEKLWRYEGMKWTRRTLDELGYVSRGRSRHRPRDASHLYGGPYPFVQTGDVKHSNLYLTTYSQTYSEAGLAQSRLWKAGTLCITIAANIADTAILGMDACFPDSVIGFVPNDEKADVRFIKYLFDATLQSRFKQFTQGAAQDNLSQSKLLSIEFTVPDVTKQHRIASILSAYDDLIENNRRRIQLLERAARLLYKEWFVHLRFPGHEHVPITDGIPKGWERKALGDFAEIKGGKQYGDNELDGYGEVPVFGGNGVQGYSLKCTHSGFLIVFGRVGANCGSVYWSYDGAWVNNNASSVVPDSHNELILQHLLHYDFGHLRKGSAQPFIPNSILSTVQFLIPTEALAIKFCETIRKFRYQQRNLDHQIRLLAQARALLLPRLMNGKVSI